MPLMPDQPYKLICEDKDGNISEVKERNGLHFHEEIIGPDRLKETTEKIWTVDWKTWIYYSRNAAINKENITQAEFIKQAKTALMEEIKKQFDDFV